MIKYKIEKKTHKKTRYGGGVRTRNLYAFSMPKLFIYYAMNSPCDWYGHITF